MPGDSSRTGRDGPKQASGDVEITLSVCDEAFRGSHL
jgi:hypothetical protein